MDKSVFKSDHIELRHVLYMTGKTLSAIGLVEIVAVITSLLYKEWNMAFNLMIGTGLFFVLSFIFIFIGRDTKDQRFSWGAGMSMVGLTWALGGLISAIPPYLSGHFASYLDAFLK